MRPMASRSTFSCDHRDAKEDITNRKQSSRTIFFMSGTPGKSSNGGLYSLGFAIGVEQIVKLFQDRRRPHSFLPGFSAGGELFSSGFFSPTPAEGFVSSSSLFLTMYCTMREMRRFEASSGLSSLRSR